MFYRQDIDGDMSKISDLGRQNASVANLECASWEKMLKIILAIES